VAIDPRALGAACDLCPLKDQTPVPPEPNKNAKLVILLETPTKDDVKDGKLLTGGTGYFFRQVFKRFQVKREQFHITSTLLCRPENPKLFKPADWKQAIKCCLPRLEKELSDVGDSDPGNRSDRSDGSDVRPVGVSDDSGRQIQSGPPPQANARTILACGAKALQVTTGRALIDNWVGAPLESRFGPVLPTWNPGAVFAEPALGPVFRVFFQRALKLSRGELAPWVWPRMVLTAGPEMEAALEELSREPVLAIDIETDFQKGRPIEHDRTTLLGIATDRLAVSVPWPPPTADLDRLCITILGNPNIEKVWHNGRGYDLYVLQHMGIHVEGPHFDTLLAHAIVAPDLPHNLGFVTTCEFHAPRWKTARKLDEMSEQEYNARDSVSTYLLRQALSKQLDATHRGWSLFRESTDLARIAMWMRTAGLLVDRSRFGNHRERLLEQMSHSKAAFIHVVGLGYDLGASGQSSDLGRLFFQDFKIPVKYRTDTGAPQLNKKALQEITVEGPPQAREAARAVLQYRKASKLISTYLDGLPVGPGGFIRPNWKVWGTITGRWSSSEPNAQNAPKEMRDLMVPRC
jgi:hypothetical protein